MIFCGLEVKLKCVFIYDDLLKRLYLLRLLQLSSFLNYVKNPLQSES